MAVNALRALSMLLLVGWTAVAGDLFGLLHECQMRSAELERRECYCPHKNEQNEGPRLEVDCCTDHAQLDAPPALAEAQRAQLAPFVPVELPQSLVGPADVARADLQLRDVPQSQGPPVYLKIRTLLI